MQRVKDITYGIGSVENVLRLLEVLRSRPSIRVFEAADHLGVARSTAHRLLTMLCAHGFVEKDQTSRVYYPGAALIEVGLAATNHAHLIERVRPHLESAAKALGETVHLAVLEGNGVRFIDGIRGVAEPRVDVHTGLLLPAHCTAAGKALLAELSAIRFMALYPRGMSWVVPGAVSDIDVLAKELESVRKKGFAVNRDESAEGTSALAVCIWQRGRAAGALAVVMPTVRLPQERVRGTIRELKKSAAALLSN